MPKVIVDATPQEEKPWLVRIRVELENWPKEDIIDTLGEYEKLVENALNMSYDEFLEKYQYLYCDRRDNIGAHDGKRLFNVDILTRYDNGYDVTVIDAAWRQLTQEDIEKAIDQFLEVTEKIYRKLIEKLCRYGLNKSIKRVLVLE